MTTETTTEATETTTTAKDIGELSFAEYEAHRRGESAKTSAPEVKASEQKDDSTESGTEEKDEELGAKDDLEDSDEAEDLDESRDEAKDKPKKVGGFQRRINKLNAAKAEAEREANYWKKLALEKEAAGEKKVEKAEAKAPSTGKPSPDDFDTHAEYVEALTDWKVEEKARALEEKTRKTALQTQQEKLLEAHTERVKSFAEKTKDFQDVLENVDDIPVSATVQELIVTSDNGPELMYELAKNRDEFERISKLSPLAAAREIGRIETKLQKASSEVETPKPKITKAPKPIEPVGSGKGTIAKTIYDPNLPFTEYERIRREQMRQKQR